MRVCEGSTMVCEGSARVCEGSARKREGVRGSAGEHRGVQARVLIGYCEYY